MKKTSQKLISLLLSAIMLLGLGISGSAEEPLPEFGIEVTPDLAVKYGVDFGYAVEGYSLDYMPQTLTVTNTGTSSFTIPLPKDDSGNFDVTAVSGFVVEEYLGENTLVMKLASGEKAEFSICPKAGLSAGDYETSLFFAIGDYDTPVIEVSFGVAEVPVIEIPIVKTVVQGGTAEPPAATFRYVVDFGIPMPLSSDSGYTITGDTIETNGAGVYETTLKIAFSDYSTYSSIEGFNLMEVNDGVEGWTYSDLEYYVEPRWLSSEDSEMKWIVCIEWDEETGNWIDLGQASFTNTYTADAEIDDGTDEPDTPDTPDTPDIPDEKPATLCDLIVKFISKIVLYIINLITAVC